jgi:hypothetical protein
MFKNRKDMKATFKLFIISAALVMISMGCTKNDMNSGDSSGQSDKGELKGKPNSQLPYTLAPTATQLQVYGVWHAGNDYCTWGAVRDMEDFDNNNNWIIDRGDGTPSVNLVVLSFVNPLKLLNQTTDATTLDGVPIGMNSLVVNYFKSHGIRVMLSIGGITYTDAWNTALATDPFKLAANAAAVANRLGVGIEIDYEENTNANLEKLETFINTYRSIIHYDATGVNPAARLTIDLAAGDRWLISICRKATADWLQTTNPVLDYANAMVPARQPSASEAISNWDEHIDGKPQYAPPILPLAPCKFTGGLYINGSRPIPECTKFLSSIQYADRDFVTRIMSGITGATPGMLGYMFWAAECPSTRSLCTTGSNTCEGGVGEGSKYFKIENATPALRQQ